MDLIYIHNIHNIYISEGELYIIYDEDKQLLFNIDELYKYLPHIVAMVSSENSKQQKLYKKQLKQSLKDI